MAANFFDQSKSKKRTTIINLVVEPPSAVAEQPPKKKKAYSKHTNGFNQLNVNQRVDNCMTRQPKGNWRNHQNSCKIPYTFVSQTWSIAGKSHDILHFSPWGMKETVSRRLLKPQRQASMSYH